MKRNSKGFTLTEVLVSVVIAGILVVAVATFFIRYHRLDSRYQAKENILTEIENIYELYTGSPATFLDTLNEYYNLELTSNNRLYYDNNFKTRASEATENYLELEYTLESGKYSLKITPYYQGESVTFAGNSTFVREIRVGG